MNQKRRKDQKFKPKFVIKEWETLKVGDGIQIKDAFFVIHRINPLARQIILLGIKDPRLLSENKTNGKQ